MHQLQHNILVKKVFPNSYASFVSMGYGGGFYIVWSDRVLENKRQLGIGRNSKLAWLDAMSLAYPEFATHYFCGFMGTRHIYPEGEIKYFCPICDNIFLNYKE